MTLDIVTVPGTDLTPEQVAHVIELCSSAFGLDYGPLLESFVGRVHVLGYADRRLVAHALWLPRPLQAGAGPWLEVAYVEAVATHSDYRRRGYGTAVMRRLQQEIAGYDLGALSTGVPGWYERLGWMRWLGPLLVLKDGQFQSTPGECVMVYRTPRTGELDLRASLTARWRPFEVW
jgi:aminoglycoside 2'-N-acetyltransferase I